MSVDSEVQKLIDASIAKLTIPPDVSGRVTALEDIQEELLAGQASLSARLAALEAGTPEPPPVEPPPGVPVIPSPSNALLRYSAAEAGNLGPFKVATYPDDHIGQSGQAMTVYNRFRPGNSPRVENGALRLWARRNGNLWSSDLLATSVGGNGPTFGYGVYDVWARFSAGAGAWPAVWLYDTTSWSADEIDWPEVLENGNLTAHVHGAVKYDKYSLAKPGDIATAFHRYTIERRSGFTAFSLDGTEVARANGTLSRKLAILLDAKVGFPWSPPPAGLGDVFLDVAGVVVTP